LPLPKTWNKFFRSESEIPYPVSVTLNLKNPFLWIDAETMISPRCVNFKLLEIKLIRIYFKRLLSVIICTSWGRISSSRTQENLFCFPVICSSNKSQISVNNWDIRTGSSARSNFPLSNYALSIMSPINASIKSVDIWILFKFFKSFSFLLSNSNYYIEALIVFKGVLSSWVTPASINL